MNDTKQVFCEVCTEKRGVKCPNSGTGHHACCGNCSGGPRRRKIGTIFVVSDSDTVMKRSPSLILDPLLGHPAERKQLDDPDAGKP